MTCPRVFQANDVPAVEPTGASRALMMVLSRFQSSYLDCTKEAQTRNVHMKTGLALSIRGHEMEWNKSDSKSTFQIFDIVCK